MPKTNPVPEKRARAGKGAGFCPHGYTVLPTKRTPSRAAALQYKPESANLPQKPYRRMPKSTHPRKTRQRRKRAGLCPRRYTHTAFPRRQRKRFQDGANRQSAPEPSPPPAEALFPIFRAVRQEAFPRRQRKHFQDGANRHRVRAFPRRQQARYSFPHPRPNPSARPRRDRRTPISTPPPPFHGKRAMPEKPGLCPHTTHPRRFPRQRARYSFPHPRPNPSARSRRARAS